MEDPDPSLRESLKEMLFDGDIFRWQRLDNLIASASQGSELDLNGLLDQVLDFLFSVNGGLLRQQLVDAAIQRVDSVAWQATLRLSGRLPEPLQPPGLKQRANQVDGAEPLLDLEPIRQLVLILQALPGFEPQLLLKRLPRVLGEPELRRMGLEVARGLAERSMVHLVRDLLVSPALLRSP
jgi:hypothetical protein